MINSIKLENTATYESVEFSGLQRENFIYGANGSGKTTLSNYLMDSSNPSYNNCSITWENNNPLEILVYNKSFREKNFNSTGKIPGIFTIGEKSKDTTDRINEIHNRLAELNRKTIADNKTRDSKLEEENDLYDSFKSTVWTQLYKNNENNFKDAFEGVMRNKENFVTKVLSEYDVHKDDRALSVEELKELADKIYNSPHEKFPELPQFPGIDLEQDIENEIYSKIIIGNNDVDIAAFINKLNNSDWVNAGKEFINTEDGICPFCQQKTISEKFIKELNDFFDETYTNDLRLLNETSDSYKRDSKVLLDFLDKIEDSEKTNENTQLDLILFSAYLKTLHSEVSENLGKISNKERQPSISVKLKTHKEIIDSIKGMFNTAIQKIKEHNDIIDRLPVEKENLKNKIWCYLVKENEALISDYNKKKENYEKAISKMDERIKSYESEKTSLNEELKELNKKDITVQAAIDAINDILQNYGFMNFEIVSAQEENTYTLRRKDGSLVEDKLSEGETTFITFLYYMQLVHGSLNDDGIEKEKVLVIDDPISSLDSNILFIVSSLIKEELKKLGNQNNKVKQIILLTHNIYFYKEVSFIDGRESSRKDLTYWIIRKEEFNSEIQKYEKNPIISSYDLYWREIREHEKEGKCNIYIQNIMRRIIEHYFKLLGKYKDETLLEKFSNPHERIIARSLLCWINDGSHSLPDDLFIESPEQTTNNYFVMFKQIFINAGQEEHYNMMMSVKE